MASYLRPPGICRTLRCCRPGSAFPGGSGQDQDTSPAQLQLQAKEYGRTVAAGPQRVIMSQGGLDPVIHAPARLRLMAMLADSERSQGPRATNGPEAIARNRRRRLNPDLAPSPPSHDLRDTL